MINFRCATGFSPSTVKNWKTAVSQVSNAFLYKTSYIYLLDANQKSILFFSYRISISTDANVNIHSGFHLKKIYNTKKQKYTKKEYTFDFRPKLNTHRIVWHFEFLRRINQRNQRINFQIFSGQPKNSNIKQKIKSNDRFFFS